MIICIAGRRKGRSLLLEEGALEWLTSNSHIESASTQRHIELALCHLAQNGKAYTDFTCLSLSRACPAYIKSLCGWDMTYMHTSSYLLQRQTRLISKEREA